MSTISPTAQAVTPVLRMSGVAVRLHQIGRGARCALMVMVCLTGSVLALGITLARYAESSTTGELSTIQNTSLLMALVGAVVAAGALWRRHTAPYAVTLVAAAVPRCCRWTRQLPCSRSPP